MRYIKQIFSVIKNKNSVLLTSTFLLFFINCLSSKAQEFKFSEVRDKDGYVNIRNSKEKTDNVIDTLSNGFIVTHFGEVENNWLLVDYLKSGELLSGYIYKNRVKDIDDFKQIFKLRENENFIQFSDEIVDVKIYIKDFEKKRHSFEYFKDNVNQLYKIDGEEIYGTDGNIPKKEYRLMEVEINSKKIIIPKSALKNIYEPNLNLTKVNYDVETETLYIQSLNSDGAGGYAVLWIIKKNEYNRRIISIPF